MFAPGLLPDGFLIDECFHSDGDKGEGGIVMLTMEVSIGRFFSSLIDVTLTVVFMPMV